MLAHKDNATLREIIHDQCHCCHLLTMDLLAKSSKPGILRLLLSHLDDFEAPLSVLDVIASRHDGPFAQCLLTKFSKHQGDLSDTSLNRLEECGWVTSFTEHIQRWSDQQQEAAVRVVLASNLERARVFAVVEQVLRRGKPKARRQAVQALVQFKGLESETLLLQALEDRDPGVQVAAIEQIRGRDIPDAMACLLKLLESPHERVRHAVRVNLAEFNMNAFLSAFDVLDTENQRKMASLVKKVDLDFVAVLARELECGVRSRVLRGLEVTKLMCILPLLEQQVIALLQSNEARQALTAALKDSSLSVREAAEQSLNVFGNHVPTTLTSPGWADALTNALGTEES
jgi:hypothetical protein